VNLRVSSHLRVSPLRHVYPLGLAEID